MPLRIALIADMLEEGWPSMDLAADRLARELRSAAADVEVRLVRPRLLPVSWWLRPRQPLPTRDRVLNRYWLYRRALPAVRRWADVFHVVDHSYAHLVHVLPQDRTLVTCHDVDAFVRHTTSGPDASRLPASLADRTKTGLQRAARIICPSRATLDGLVELGIVAPERVAVVPNGADRLHLPEADGDRLAAPHLGPGTHVDLLHVGSTIPRKRIDLLLDVFAAVARRNGRVRLVRAGGPFTDAQRRQIARLGIAGRILELPPLGRSDLLAIYRRAAVVISTSEREGFCLPVAEALAASVPVVVPDLPVFREVAGEEASFVPPDRPDEWVGAIEALLEERLAHPDAWLARCARAGARGALYDWGVHATAMLDEYRRVAAAGVRTGQLARAEIAS